MATKPSMVSIGHLILWLVDEGIEPKNFKRNLTALFVYYRELVWGQTRTRARVQEGSREENGKWWGPALICLANCDSNNLIRSLFVTYFFYRGDHSKLRLTVWRRRVCPNPWTDYNASRSPTLPSWSRRTVSTRSKLSIRPSYKTPRSIGFKRDQYWAWSTSTTSPSCRWSIVQSRGRSPVLAQ